MQSEAYSAALRSTLQEIKNIRPEVQTSFLFDREGTIIACDDESSGALYETAINVMGRLIDKSETIGGFDSLVINAQKGRVHVSPINGMYLAMVTSKNADIGYLQMVSRVLMPTVIKLLDNITASLVPSEPIESLSPENQLKKTVLEEEREEEIDDEPSEEEFEKPEEFTSPAVQQIPSDSAEPTDQLIVDTLSGLLVRGDTVQIDPEILKEWSDHYDGAEIIHVEIESFNGNSAVCKVKPIKDSKIEGKRIIRIPERACQDLAVKKGEIVKVKPYMEEE